jgi:hypothetical protein
MLGFGMCPVSGLDPFPVQIRNWGALFSLAA